MPQLFCIALVLSALLVSENVQGNDEVARKLLTEYWSLTRKSETDQFYSTVKDRDFDTVYAYVLVKSRQHDVKTALAAIDDLHKLRPEHWPSWRLKTWLLLRQDRFNAATVALGKFIDVVRADKDIDDFNRTEAYRFAGRVFGFLDGPVKGKADRSTMDIVKRKILFELDADLLNAFSFEYDDVIEQYETMMKQKTKHEEDFRKKDVQERKKKLEELNKQKAQLEKSSEDLIQQGGKIQQAASEQLAELQKRDRPLAARQAELESDLFQVNGNLAALFADYNYWNTRALRESDPARRAYFFQQAGLIDGLILQQELTAASLRREINAIESDRRALRQQYAITGAIASSQLNAIDQRLRGVEQQKKITRNQTLRTTRPSRKIVTHAAALKAKAASIVTYDQFPLEVERQLMLDRLK